MCLSLSSILIKLVLGKKGNSAGRSRMTRFQRTSIYRQQTPVVDEQLNSLYQGRKDDTVATISPALSSKIRHKDFRLSFVLCPLSRSGYPPWILKRGGLENSGRRLISSNGKTKIKPSYIRKEKCRPATPTPPVSRSGDPP